jgi:hypothetical protein
MSKPSLDDMALPALQLKGRDSDSREMSVEGPLEAHAFYLLFMLCFPLILLAILPGRFMPGNSEPGVRQSIFSEASNITRSTIAIILTS